MHSTATRLLCSLAALVTVLAAPASAVRKPLDEPLRSLGKGSYGFIATPAPVPLEEVADELPSQTLADVAAFEASAGGSWRFFVDRRSGGMTLVEGSGVEWIASGHRPSAAELETRARALMASYPHLFRVDPATLELDGRGTLNFGERDQFWQVAFKQRIGGVPVKHSWVVFRISHGNLVQFGVDRILPIGAKIPSSRPTLTASEARGALAGYVGGLLGGDIFLREPELRYEIAGTPAEPGYAGPVGAGWEAHLIYESTFQRPGQLGAWETFVDAHTGEVLRFADSNRYGNVVAGSVYLQTNCADPSNCVPGDIPELAATMPEARVLFNTGAETHASAAGGFDYDPLASSGTVTLDGLRFTFADACGAIAAPGVGPTPGPATNIDLGTTPPPPTNDGLVNTDCAPATDPSAGQPGPFVPGGTGNTHAARTMYYHLNLINQKARFYLPQNEWLLGLEGPTDTRPHATTNGPPACNAFYQGTTNTLTFLRRTTAAALNCNNLGEISDVALHEWGHGIDNNDASGSAPEGGTGEAMGDSFALFQSQNSCVGPGAILDSVVDATWFNTAGYGDAASALCTGVRELDYTRFCTGGAPGSTTCGAQADPDCPAGSRSGFTPPFLPSFTQDVGTPAAWWSMVSENDATDTLAVCTAPAGAADGICCFHLCGGPEDGEGGCAGPLNHGCHCESQIASEANFDLAKRIIELDFGGSAYTVPQGGPEVSGWQYMDRLWYLTRDTALSAYMATGSDPVVSTGCGTSTWWATYRFVDDDNGNLADGTPHAAEIFDAFDLHAMACGEAGDAMNGGPGCPAPLPAPTLSIGCSDAPVGLTWNEVSGAGSYRVLRNTLGCGLGFAPLAELGAPRTYYEDPQVAAGAPVYYRVQPVGTNPSCYGQASNCVAVTPTECSVATIGGPLTLLALNTPADNQIQVVFDPSALGGTIKVMRKDGDCSSTAPFDVVGRVPNDGSVTTFIDASGIQGQQEYAYMLQHNPGCGACDAETSACLSVLATGACTVPPVFGGVGGVVPVVGEQCQLDVAWDPASAACGALSYDVHRSDQPVFAPDATTLIANVAGTSYSDATVQSGQKYHYIVRARDTGGNTDSNLISAGDKPAGPLGPPGSSFDDDAGDTVSPQQFASPVSSPTPWAVRPTGGVGGSRGYATTASGNYPDTSCLALESDTIFLGDSPTLAFQSAYAIEPNWDGGIVEISTAAGGFDDWTKITTINYPGLRAGITTIACNNPGFDNGQAIFTGDSGGAFSAFSGSLATWANQAVRIRFLMGSDDATNEGGWFVDDVSIDDVRLPGECAGGACAGLPPLFADAFGLDVPAWSVVRNPAGHLTGIGAGLGGTAAGLQVTIDHNPSTSGSEDAEHFVLDQTPDGIGTYCVEFLFDPNGSTLARRTKIFAARGDDGIRLLRAMVRENPIAAEGAPAYQIRFSAQNDNFKWVNLPWVDMADGENLVGLTWAQGSGGGDGEFRLLLNGTEVATRTDFNNDDRSLGVQAIGNLGLFKDGTTATLRWDEFVSFGDAATP